jgi:hypothetical protein
VTPLAAPRHLQPIRIDARRRRLWILGQRCHHGATGALLAGVAAGGLLAGAAGGLAGAKLTARTSVALCAAASLLMAHDWKDRSMWFRPGEQR